jgi:hypothetical protein
MGDLKLARNAFLEKIYSDDVANTRYCNNNNNNNNNNNDL